MSTDVRYKSTQTSAKATTEMSSNMQENNVGEILSEKVYY